MNSTFGKTFLFLTNLAWKSRVTLPVLITAGFMILNFRWEVEINIHSERIAIQGMEEGRAGGGRPRGVAAIDYSLETVDDSDIDDDDDDEDDETDYDESDGDETYSDDEGANDEIRIALVTF